MMIPRRTSPVPTLTVSSQVPWQPPEMDKAELVPQGFVNDKILVKCCFPEEWDYAVIFKKYITIQLFLFFC